MSKVSMGKTLDAFHAALAKTTSSGDLGPANIAIGNLSNVAQSYLEDVKKLKKFPNLEAAVTKEIVTKLKAFVTALEQAAKNANAEINRVEHEIQNRIEMENRPTTECDGRVNPFNAKLQEMANKYKMGVPKNDVPTLTKIAKTGGELMATYKKAIAELDHALVEAVTENARDHRPIIDKLNSELGAAKGRIKVSNEAINLGIARTKELDILLKKVIG